MKSKDLAEFHNVHERTTRKWPKEQRHRKTIQAEADVTPLEWQLVGEIAQLVYAYNAKGWHGANPTDTALLSVGAHHVCVTIFKRSNPACERNISAQVSSTAEMQLIKLQLEKLVY